MQLKCKRNYPVQLQLFMITCTWRFAINRPNILLRLNRVKFKTIIMVMLAMSIAGFTLIMLYLTTPGDKYITFCCLVNQYCVYHCMIRISRWNYAYKSQLKDMYLPWI